MSGHYGALPGSEIAQWLTDNGFAVAQQDGRLTPTAAAVSVGSMLRLR